jgi:hypothetical protein
MLLLLLLLLWLLRQRHAHASRTNIGLRKAKRLLYRAWNVEYLS